LNADQYGAFDMEFVESVGRRLVMASDAPEMKWQYFALYVHGYNTKQPLYSSQPLARSCAPVDIEYSVHQMVSAYHFLTLAT
jgi:hypothetical protein